MAMREWSDDELLRHEFLIKGRPDNDLTLQRGLPDLSRGVAFPKYYNITPPRQLPNRRKMAPYVWCALCQEATHWRGWRAQTPDGAEFLVGRNCAGRHGADMRAAAADAERWIRRQRLLLRREAVLKYGPRILEVIRAWARSPEVLQVEAWAEGFRADHPSLRRWLWQVARVSPPVLLVERRHRDLAAEEARGEGSDAPIYRFISEAVGTLPCPALFAGARPKDRLISIYRMVDGVLRQVQPEDQSSRNLAKALKPLSALGREVDALVEDYRSLPQLSQKATWEMIAVWTSEAHGWRHMVQGRRLVSAATKFSDRRVRTSLPNLQGLHPPPELAGLIDALRLDRPDAATPTGSETRLAS